MMDPRLEEQIQSLPQQHIKGLRLLWQSYFDSPAPRFNKITLANKLAYRMQELAYGGMTAATRKQLRDLADDASTGNKRQYKANRPVPGTRLMRDHGGQQHAVTVLTRGFEYNGKVYRSLSGVATAITGARWSGNVFFGLATSETPLRARRAA
jgi:hypothetical protein